MLQLGRQQPRLVRPTPSTDSEMAEDELVNWWGMEGSAVGFRALAAISVQCGPHSWRKKGHVLLSPCQGDVQWNCYHGVGVTCDGGIMGS